MTTTHSDRVGVVGGGLGGLAAACTLAARGYRVILLERNGWLGGKAAVLQEQGYRFDMGPTILTVPSVLRRIFSEAGQQLEDHLDLIRLDPQWRCFFDDGSVLDLHQDVDTMSAVLEDFSPGTDASQGYRRFLDLSQRLEEISQRFFFWRPVGSPWDMFDLRTSFQPSLLRAILDMRPGDPYRQRCVSTCPMPAWPRCSTTSPSMSAQRRINRQRCCAASRTCRPTKACGIHAAARAPCRKLWKDWPSNLASRCAWESACGASFSIPSGVCEVFKPMMASKSR